MERRNQPEADIPRAEHKLVNGGSARAFVAYKSKTTGCDLKWHIEAIYEGPLPCMGKEEVLAELNKVAWGLCATIRPDCPKKCPQPTYDPATKLNDYWCDDKQEYGHFQPLEWNCGCAPEPIT